MCTEGFFFKLPNELKEILSKFSPHEIELRLKSLEDLISTKEDTPKQLASNVRHHFIFSLMIRMPLTPTEISNLKVNDLSFNPQRNCWLLNIDGNHNRVVNLPTHFTKIITEYLGHRKELVGIDLDCETLFLSRPKKIDGESYPVKYSLSNIVQLLKNSTRPLFNGSPLNSISFRALYIIREMKRENTIQNFIRISADLGLSDETMIDTYYQLANLTLEKIKINLGRKDWNAEDILIHEDLVNICTTHNPYWFLDQCIEQLEIQLKFKRNQEDPVPYLINLRDILILCFMKFLPIRLSEIESLLDTSITMTESGLHQIQVVFRGVTRIVESPVNLSNYLTRWQEAKKAHGLKCNNLVFPAHLKINDGAIEGKVFNSTAISTMIERHILLISSYDKYANISCFRQMYFFTELQKSSSINNFVKTANTLGISFAQGLNLYKQIKLKFVSP
jgi:hypothetical protein